MELYIWANGQKGGGAKCLAKRFTFKGFILLNSITIVLSIAKCPKGGDLGCAKNICLEFFWNFYQFRLSKSAGRKNSVQKPNIFSEANKMKGLRCFVCLLMRTVY